MENQSRARGTAGLSGPANHILQLQTVNIFVDNFASTCWFYAKENKNPWCAGKSKKEEHQ